MSGTQPSGGPPSGGLFSQPWALAAGAAGLISALCTLWAMRGLPLGGLMLWLTPLPIFAAAAAFGGRVAGAAVALGAAVVLAGAYFLPVAPLIYLGLFGLPATLIAITATPPGAARLALGTPLALLGLWPVLLLLGLVIAIPDLEAVMRQMVEDGLREMGADLPPALLDQVVQVKAAAAGFWLSVLLLVNGLAAQRLVNGRGYALRALPAAGDVRLPGWYLPLPLVALALWIGLGGSVALSSVLLLLLPFFLLGVVGVHRRISQRAGRTALLVSFYLLLLLFVQIMAPVLVGLGLFDQWRRRPSPPPTP